MGFQVRDALVSPITVVLPATASLSTFTTVIDTGNIDGDFLAESELLLTTPTLTTAQLPDADTVTYNIQTSTDSSFGGTLVLASSFVVQTGAGAAGSTGSTKRFRLPTNVQRYVRVQASAGTAAGANLTSSSFTVDLLF